MGRKEWGRKGGKEIRRKREGKGKVIPVLVSPKTETLKVYACVSPLISIQTNYKILKENKNVQII